MNDDDDERDDIILRGMLDRQYTPQMVRKMAELAREADDMSARKDAISMLVERRILATREPSDEELRRVESMSDEEITAVLLSASH